MDVRTCCQRNSEGCQRKCTYVLRVCVLSLRFCVLVFFRKIKKPAVVCSCLLVLGGKFSLSVVMVVIRFGENTEYSINFSFRERVAETLDTHPVIPLGSIM